MSLMLIPYGGVVITASMLAASSLGGRARDSRRSLFPICGECATVASYLPFVTRSCFSEPVHFALGLVGCDENGGVWSLCGEVVEGDE